MFSKTEEVNDLNFSYSLEKVLRFWVVKIILSTIIEIAARIKEIINNLRSNPAFTFLIASS